jgi:hypothetical protein
MMLGEGNKDVDNILHLINPGTSGAEIGVWKGDTSKKFLASGVSLLYLIDPFSIKGYSIPIAANDTTFNLDKWLLRYSSMIGGMEDEDVERYYNMMYNKLIDEFVGVRNAVICRMTSDQWFTFFLENKKPLLDWIYIDGDHSYTGVLNDLTRSLNVVKYTGLILGDDYTSKPGVQQAVNEFIDTHQFGISFYGKNQYCIRR